MRSLVGSVGPGMAPGIALSRKSTGRSLPELTNVLRFNRYQQVQVHVSTRRRLARERKTRPSSSSEYGSRKK